MRMSGLGGWLPFASGNDFTNMYAMMNNPAMINGMITSEMSTVFQRARGVSPDILSDG